MYIYIDICMHLHICMYTYIHIHVFIYGHMHSYVYMHICIHIYTYSYICIYIWAHAFIYIYVYMHVCIYVHMYILVKLNMRLRTVTGGIFSGIMNQLYHMVRSWKLTPSMEGFQGFPRHTKSRAEKVANTANLRNGSTRNDATSPKSIWFQIFVYFQRLYW